MNPLPVRLVWLLPLLGTLAVADQPTAARGASEPAQDAIILTVTADPATVDEGQRCTITVRARLQSTDTALDGIAVRVTAGGGRFLASANGEIPSVGRLHGPYEAAGVTDASGTLTTWWVARPAAPAYALSVFAETHDLPPVRREVIVYVRPTGSASDAPGADLSPPPRRPQWAVAVLPFENRTGDAALDDWRQALPTSVRSCLGRADSTRTPGRETIQSALQRSDWTAGNAVDTALARRVARAANATVAVWGRYRRQGDSWTADVRVLRVGGETPPVEVQATAPQWVDLAESLALQVAGQLGRRIAEEERRVWRMTMPNSGAGATRFAHAVNLEIREASAAERESAWRDVLSTDPQCGMAHGSLIRLLSEAQRKSECRQASDEFLLQQPDLCYAHLAHAWILGTDGEVAAAEAALREALRLHPGCPEATEGLFDVLATTGRWADLVSALEGTLDRRPDDEPARAFLAAALAQTGKLAEARDLLEPIKEPPEESELVDLALLQAALAVGDIELAGLELQRLGPKTATNPQIRSTLDSAKLIIRRPPGGHADPPILRPRAFTSEEINTELERRLTPEEQKLAVNPLEITPELAAEARRLTTGLTNDALRSFALFAEVCRRGRGSGDGGQRTASKALTDSRDPEIRLSCQEHAKLFVVRRHGVSIGSASRS